VDWQVTWTCSANLSKCSLPTTQAPDTSTAPPPVARFTSRLRLLEKFLSGRHFLSSEPMRQVIGTSAASDRGAGSRPPTHAAANRTPSSSAWWNDHTPLPLGRWLGLSVRIVSKQEGWARCVQDLRLYFRMPFFPDRSANRTEVGRRMLPAEPRTSSRSLAGTRQFHGSGRSGQGVITLRLGRDELAIAGWPRSCMTDLLMMEVVVGLNLSASAKQMIKFPSVYLKERFILALYQNAWGLRCEAGPKIVQHDHPIIEAENGQV